MFMVDHLAIYTFNHVKKELTPIHEFGKFGGKLIKQPDQFKMNSRQTIAFISAGKDSLFVNFESEKFDREMDFDFEFEIIDIYTSLNANGKFYLLANRYKKFKGLFLIELNENDPCNREQID